MTADSKVLKSLQASQRWAEPEEVEKPLEAMSFEAEVWLWSSPESSEKGGSWHFVTMPEPQGLEIKNTFGKTHANRNGLVRVSAQIGKTQWKTSLLWHNPTRSYLVALKASVRKAESIQKGDVITVKFTILPLGSK